MLNSLIHGSEVLSEEELVDSMGMNGRPRKRKVIDVKKYLIEDERYFFFGIGHSNSKSETFLPAIHYEAEK